MILNFDVKDCNYVIRWSQVLFRVATGTSWNMGNSSHLYVWVFFLLYYKNGHILEQFAQVSCRIFMLRNTQSWMNQSCFVQEHRLHDLPRHIPFSLICAVILCHKIFPPVCQFTKDFFLEGTC